MRWRCRVKVDKGEVRLDTDVAEMAASSLRLSTSSSAAEILGVDDPRPQSARVLKLTSSGSSDPLEWLSLDGFSDKRWHGAVQRRVAKALTSKAGAGGGAPPAALGLSPAQMTIVQDCMQSLATSRD